MWKIVVGFILFAALSLFVIIKGGDNLDMSGEKHGTETSHEEAKPAEPAPGAPATAPAVEAAPAQKP